MTFNKKKVFHDNYDAIKEIFEGNRKKNWNQKILSKYKGYGGLKEVLFDIEKKDLWNQTSLKYYEDVKQLHDLIYSELRKDKADEMLATIKANASSSFYTDKSLTDGISSVVSKYISNKEKLDILEPSAGQGVFINSFKSEFEKYSPNIVGIDKDKIAAYIAKKVHGVKVHPAGFQEIDKLEPKKRFDIVTSNIPFGSIKIFDPEFSRSTNPDLKQSTQKIHNYFFTKGIDKTKEGGLLAFITSTGVMDTVSNDFLRKHLIKNAELISAVRLPNNTFSSAGTKVASDLIILRKRNAEITESKFTQDERDFIKTSEYKIEGQEFNLNNYFQKNPKAILGDLALGKFHGNRTILTVDPDEDKKEIEQIAESMTKVIDDDFSNRYVKSAESKVTTTNPVRDQFTEIALQHDDVQSFFAAIVGEETGINFKSVAVQKSLGLHSSGENFREKNRKIIEDFFNEVKKNPELEVDNINKAELERLGQQKEVDQKQIDLLKLNPANYWNSVIIGMFEEKERVDLVEKMKSHYTEISEIKEDSKKLEIHPESEPLKKERGPSVRRTKEKTPVTYSKEFIQDLGLLDGNLYKEGKVIGTLKENDENFTLEPLTKLTGIRKKRASGIIDIRDSYKRIHNFEFDGLVSEAQTERKELNRIYDEFVEQYGTLNSRANNSITALDSQPFIIRGLEREERGEYIKADLFFEADIQEQIQVDDLEGAIEASLNDRGKIDIEFVSELLDQSADYTIKEGIDKDLLFANPVFPSNWNPLNAIDDITAYDNIKFEWTSKEEFQSGFIENKIEAVQLARSPYHTRDYKENLVNLLEEVKPSRLSYDDVDPRLGERWIDPKIYQEFFREYLDNSTVTVSYDSNLDDYQIKREGSTQQELSLAINPVDSRRISGKKLLEHTLYDTTPNITKQLDKNTRVIDTKAVKEFEVKSQQVKEAFKHFLEEKPKYKIRLTNEYNLLEVQKVKRESKGDYLKFNTMHTYKPHPHQKDAISTLINNKGGIIDHVVGAGKTLVMVGAAMEMKRMGIVNKPMIIGLKANVGDIYKAFKTAYPKSKVLCPPKNDVSNGAKRLEFLQRAQNNDWDCVIMTHEQFEKIPQDANVQEKVIKEELDNAKENYRIQSEGNLLSKRQEKGMLESIENLEVKLQEVQFNMRRDDWVDFKTMGIDKLFVDESQKFKNLAYTTRHSDVAGLGPAKGSKRSFNLLMAARTLQEHHGGDKGLTFLSGTMISNSIVEMYSIMKYLRPTDLKMKGTQSFDAWAAKFANKTTEYEFTVTNEIKKKARFRSFTKVPELSKSYNEISHVVNHKNFTVDRPKAVNKFVDIEPTFAQEQYSKNLVQFAKTGEGSYINKVLTDNQKKAKMLLATDHSAKMSIDMRLLDPSLYGKEDGSKLPRLCQNVADHYQRFDEHKGTQLVFSDMGVPGGASIDLYQEIKKSLIDDYGIPEHEIAFIHDYKTDNQKQALFDKVNDGEIRVLLGSTQMLGTGVSVQQRITALHHLDMQWNPANFEQRNGRGIRQGNWLAKEHNNNEVDLFIYGTKRTLDSYKFNLMSTKQNFIDQVKSNTVSARTMDEGGGEDSVNFAEYAAILSGKTELLDKMKAEKKLSELEERSIAAGRLVARGKAHVRDMEGTIVKKQSYIAQYRTDDIAYQKAFPIIDPETKARDFGKNDKGEQLTNKEFGQILIDKANAIIENNPKSSRKHLLFEKGDFKMNISYSELKSKWIFDIQSAKTERHYSHNFGNLPLKTPESMGKLFERSLGNLEWEINNAIKNIDATERNIATQLKIIEKNESFDNSKEVAELTAEVERLDEILQSQDEQEISNSSSIPTSIYNYLFTEEDHKLLTSGESISDKAFFNAETGNAFIAKAKLYNGNEIEFFDRIDINKITYDAFADSINKNGNEYTMIESQFDKLYAPDSFEDYTFSNDEKNELEKGKFIEIEKNHHKYFLKYDVKVQDVISVSNFIEHDHFNKSKIEISM